MVTRRQLHLQDAPNRPESPQVLDTLGRCEGPRRTAIFLLLCLDGSCRVILWQLSKSQTERCCIFCVFCHGSIKKVKNQGPLPTQQRVALVPAADEVRHAKHAGAEKKRS